MLLWINPKGSYVSNTGLLPSMARLSRQLLLHKNLLTFCRLKPARVFLNPHVLKGSRIKTINRLHSFTLIWVWAPSRSLAATREMLELVSFPPATELFHFAGFPLVSYASTKVKSSEKSDPGLTEPGFPIRTSPINSAPWRLIEAFRSLARPSSV